jgi:hypothetical protein
MNRPISVTVIAILFLAVGVITVVSGASKLVSKGSFADGREELLVLSINTLAIVAGAGLLRGMNWARFLVLGWMAFHVVLSFWHAAFEVALHAFMFAVLWYFLFGRKGQGYFAPHSVKTRTG